MTKLTFQTFARWCTECGYRLESSTPSLADSSDLLRVDIPIPQEVLSMTEMLDDLINLESPNGYVVWVRDWTIWNERSQEIGLRHLELLTLAAVREDVSDNGHVYELTSAEWRDAIALIAVPILYSWDAHLLFRSGRALVDVTHHDTLSVSLHNGDSQLAAKLEPWRALSKAGEPGQGAGA